MNPPNTSYREQTLELERERLRYIKCGTIIDLLLVIGIIVITIVICIYFLLVVMKNKSVTIS